MTDERAVVTDVRCGAETLLAGYEAMVLIREFEEAVIRLHEDGRIPGVAHVSVGQEAVSAGVGLALEVDDFVVTTHRGHGDIIAKGVAVEGMIAELMARGSGLCKGKGGSMHVTEVARGVLGANGIVAANLPIAVGAALAIKRRGRPSVSVAFCGDGAFGNGSFHEALNMAALWGVPVVFVRTTNQYAESTPRRHFEAPPDIGRFVEGYGLRCRTVHGNDFAVVHQAARRLVDEARHHSRPAFLECETYRKYGHKIGDPGTDRPADEIARWAGRDPIARLGDRLVRDHGVGADALNGMQAAAAARVAAAIDAAQAAPAPDPAEAFTDVFGRAGAWPLAAGR